MKVLNGSVGVVDPGRKVLQAPERLLEVFHVAGRLLKGLIGQILIFPELGEIGVALIKGLPEFVGPLRGTLDSRGRRGPGA